MYFGILLALLLTKTVFVDCYEDTLTNQPKLKQEELGDMIHYAIKFPKVLKMLMEGFDNNIAYAVNNFGDNLYKQVAKEEGNVIISPFSVHSGLSMLALGASQSTLDELLSYLFFKNVDVLKMSYLSFYNEHRNASKKIFILANSVFVNRGYTLIDSFKNDAAKVFDAEVRNVDFSKPHVAEGIINDWVANKTNRKISSLVSEIGPDVVALLLNAIYFKGTWKMKFDPAKTVKLYEFQTENNVTFCNMMKMKGAHFNYLEDSSFKLLELDMSDDNIKIAFVKPSYPNVTLADVENDLTASLFFAKIKNAHKIRLSRILIPRLQIIGDYALKTSLQSMGIKEIFEFANLEKMLKLLKPLETYVSEVNHKAIMEINEEGVVAAAATSIKVVGRSGRSKGPEFVLDRPFMVFLYCKKTEIIVFKGRVKNPGTFLPPPKREIKPISKKRIRKQRW